MRLVRKSTSEAVSLEDGFLWSDEFEWKPIEQKLERAIDGTAIIQGTINYNTGAVEVTPILTSKQFKQVYTPTTVFGTA